MIDHVTAVELAQILNLLSIQFHVARSLLAIQHWQRLWHRYENCSSVRKDVVCLEAESDLAVLEGLVAALFDEGRINREDGHFFVLNYHLAQVVRDLV